MTVDSSPTRAAVAGSPRRPPKAPTGPMKPRGLTIAGVAFRTPYWVFTGGVAVVFLFPLVWTAVASVSPQAGTNQVTGWGFGNYATLADYQAGIWRYLANSAFVSLLTVALTLLISFLGGYAFARFRFPGRNLLFLLTLAILMVPYATLLIPLYVLLNEVGLQNSLVGVALVLTMFQLPFSTFLMRISFEAVPRELDEAAMVDGCTSFGALWRVLVPAVKPGLITVGLFAFLAAWNDFMAPLILINDSERMTLPLAVSNLRGQVQGVVDYGATEAGVVVLALPCIVLFLLLQRHYVRGFMSGALKG
jgi:multiple sugar transport system permease protein